MTRLTFTKNERGDVLKTKQLIAREKVIDAHILLREDGYYYFVNDIDNDIVLLHGVTSQISVAKKLIKDKFKELGVIILDEVRKTLEEE